MTENLVLDTHSLVWLVEGDPRLGLQARQSAEASLQADRLSVSVMSYWEIAMLVRAGRLILAATVGQWHRRALDLGIIEASVTGQIGILAGELEGLPGDPADRIITATALTQGATLITADEHILGWSGTLLRQDARE